MSHPEPEPPHARELVWAPDEVVVRLERQVRPPAGPLSRIMQAAVTALVFTWPPAFVVFAVTAGVAPAVTDGAGVGATAFWALQVAALIAVTAMVEALRRPAAGADAAEPPRSPRRTALRLALHALVTAGCAGLVLALQGLTAGQIAVLAGGLVVVLHLLPTLVARLLHRHGKGPLQTEKALPANRRTLRPAGSRRCPGGRPGGPPRPGRGR